jgi:N-methylhydantoinase A
LVRPLYAGGSWHDAQVLARDGLIAGCRVEGPAIVQQFDATTVIEPGAVATVDPVGNLRIRVGGTA